MIIEEIEGQIQSTDFYSVIADETTDSSTKNQMSLIARYVHEGELVERFLGFSNVSNLSGFYKMHIVHSQNITVRRTMKCTNLYIAVCITPTVT